MTVSLSILLSTFVGFCKLDGDTHALRHTAATETEEAELEYIRVTYVPELILQYHNVLYFSARTLTSEYLVDCMNLSTQVADNQELTRVFVAARRMTELVDALALSSKAIVNTRSAGKKKFANGETLEIWDVKVEDDEANELFEEASRG